ncbi:MAG: energy-coupling factor ABC transporter substrate-binding protein [Actinobacteria bacterium]|nr:energy-coupling factor ABC transporter substrate-binding protein [Actinomycetota bacterium]
MKTGRWTPLLLVGAVIVLMVVPLVVSSSHDFAGADSKAQAAITTADPGYKPWFTPLWEPSSETATMLFSLQAAFGAGVVFFAFGYWSGRRKGREQGPPDTAGGDVQTDARLAASHRG